MSEELGDSKSEAKKEVALIALACSKHCEDVARAKVKVKEYQAPPPVVSFDCPCFLFHRMRMSLFGMSNCDTSNNPRLNLLGRE